jgi:hypothetical protein
MFPFSDRGLKPKRPVTHAAVHEIPSIGIAQSVGIALTGLCKFDDLVCE